MIVAPSFNKPFSSASSIIAFAILSLTDPAGLKYSSFANIFAFKLFFFSQFTISNSGVLPTNSVERFLDIHYSDEYLKKIYNNAKVLPK